MFTLFIDYNTKTISKITRANAMNVSSKTLASLWALLRKNYNFIQECVYILLLLLDQTATSI